MLSHVLHSLECIREICIAAHQHRRIVEVVPCEVEKVGRKHDIDAFLHLRALGGLDASKSHLEIGRLSHGLKELLLLTKGVRALARILEGVVIVGTKEAAFAAEFLHELGEVEVMALHGRLECVVEIASVDENRDSLCCHDLIPLSGQFIMNSQYTAGGTQTHVLSGQS